LYYKDCSFYLELENKRKPVFPIELRAALFNADDFSSLSTASLLIENGVQYPKKKLQLLSTDKQTINRFLHYTSEVKLGTNVSIIMLQTFVSDNLTGLMNALKKEYHLK